MSLSKHKSHRNSRKSIPPTSPLSTDLRHKFNEDFRHELNMKSERRKRPLKIQKSLLSLENLPSNQALENISEVDTVHDDSHKNANAKTTLFPEQRERSATTYNTARNLKIDTQDVGKTKGISLQEVSEHIELIKYA